MKVSLKGFAVRIEQNGARCFRDGFLYVQVLMFRKRRMIEHLIHDIRFDIEVRS